MKLRFRVLCASFGENDEFLGQYLQNYTMVLIKSLNFIDHD